MTKYERYMREADRYTTLARSAAKNNERKAVAFTLCAQDWEERAKRLTFEEASK